MIDIKQQKAACRDHHSSKRQNNRLDGSKIGKRAATGVKGDQRTTPETHDHQARNNDPYAE